MEVEVSVSFAMTETVTYDWRLWNGACRLGAGVGRGECAIAAERRGRIGVVEDEVEDGRKRS